MTYAIAAALQSAVFDRLRADPRVAALVGDAVFDAPPAGRMPPVYVSLGPEEVRDRSDADGSGAEHRFVITVVSEDPGFARAKDVAGAVSDAMAGGELILARGRVIGLWFERASARRGGPAGRLRRIDLRFRARVEDNQST